MEKPNKLPKISDLDLSPEVALKNDQLKTLLNAQPKNDWVKQHPMARGVVYLPIERVEYLLDVIFQRWRVEVLQVAQLFQSVQVTIRLHFFNPVTGEWDYHDGIGAMAVQTDKGASASDLGAIKNDAVMKAAPAAKSYAIKDAAEHLGKLFGRDLNRADQIAFTPRRVTSDDEKLEKIRVLFNDTQHWLSNDQVADVQRIIDKQEVAQYDSVINHLAEVDKEVQIQAK